MSQGPSEAEIAHPFIDALLAEPADSGLHWRRKIREEVRALVAARATQPPYAQLEVAQERLDRANIEIAELRERARATVPAPRSEQEFQFVRSALAWCVGNLEQEGVALPKDVLRAMQPEEPERVGTMFGLAAAQSESANETSHLRAGVPEAPPRAETENLSEGL